MDKIKPTTKPVNDFLTFVYRILFLYLLWALCRAGFWFANAELIGPVTWAEAPRLLKGAFIFDSASIFYINLPFLVLSLLPFRFRSRDWYQKVLLWLFVAINAIGLAVNIADIFYYPFKLGRITWDDTHFLTGGNFGTLLLGFLGEYWYGFIAWIGLGVLLWYVFKKIGYRPTVIRNNLIYYTTQTALLALSVLFAIMMIRGGTFSRAIFPINISGAGLYASPSKAGLVLSNPFAIIRTSGNSLPAPGYFPEEELESIFTPVHRPAASSMKLEGRPNVMLIILESFGSAHIKELSDRFPEDMPSYTPFLDSLIRNGYIFRNAYQNGNRSMDAVPSLLASIPSFKKQFLSMPQSMAEYRALPQCMKEMGYSTAFLHGAVRESMSFVAFSKTTGTEYTYSQEDYESMHGRRDFDGKWGIWDHKFFPYAAERIAEMPQPFFATMFTLSSHHPYLLPEGFEGRYPEGPHPIHHMYGYSDEALRKMFDQMALNDWFANTVFIITADHGFKAQDEKYKTAPYNYAVPLVLYSPGGLIPAGEDLLPAGHIDVMPTLLGMLGYDKPYFAFGRNLFGEGDKPRRTINYNSSAFDTISEELLYIFNDQYFTGIYNYRLDPLQENNLSSEVTSDDASMRWTKAFIQQYYRYLKEGNYIPDNDRRDTN